MNHEAIKAAVKEAMGEELKSFYVEREQHYQDHCFIKEVRETRDKIRTTACTVVTNGGITGLGLLVLWGIVEWIRSIRGH